MRSKRPSQIGRYCSVQDAISARGLASSAHGRYWASRPRTTRPACSSTLMCLEIVGRDMSNGAASSLTVAAPPARRARIARRVVFARAAKVSLRRWSSVSVCVPTQPYLHEQLISQDGKHDELASRLDRVRDAYRREVAFDEGLAERIRYLTVGDDSIRERKMFGGLAFLCNGHMACGIVGRELMVRVGVDAWPAALAQPHAREMDFTGRSMRGMVYVGVDGFAEDKDLSRWVTQGLAHARSLPPK